ncbi:hypothetical protein [Fangia hongkongensis]|uniref:hypothetical protein n=1 Tax=Fangia hongkongensis TaxID=270495 RepID=UPI000370855D|nr:hypothetical protein [Fangia hongkongensis]MBK2124364.1 hypothetical protein [Fangia hongkongensis]
MLDNSNNTMMSESRFKSSANLMKNYYDLDNAWFGFFAGGQAWSAGQWQDFVEAAWILYRNVFRNSLEIILLGDTKIRSDKDLLTSRP